jgi:hypothetical protein
MSAARIEEELGAIDVWVNNARCVPSCCTSTATFA